MSNRTKRKVMLNLNMNKSRISPTATAQKLQSYGFCKKIRPKDAAAIRKESKRLVDLLLIVLISL